MGEMSVFPNVTWRHCAAKAHYPNMTSKQLRAFLTKTGLTKRGAARLIEISARNMYRYTAGELPVPRTVELALRWVASNPEYRKT